MRKTTTEGPEPARASLAAEIRQDATAANGYAESHGSFADFVREHYERDDSAASVK